MLTDAELKSLLEAAIFVAEKPLSIARMKEILLADYRLSTKRLSAILNQLKEDYNDRGIELVEVASGYRFQAQAVHNEQLIPLFKEKAPRFSRALLETLSLIAYKQPITRGEIEEIRGVAVSSYIIKTLQERGWVKVIGHKEVPGRPSLYGTNKEFLDYFSLTSLSQLPELMVVTELTNELELSNKLELSNESGLSIEPGPSKESKLVKIPETSVSE
ncbi:MAG: SMC-Scp complex subunit ScpB [Alteromonadaceae bacterium]|nr:SMC-Scp complex subunit ScpB [Alteromonadaceae bacterium]